MKKIIICTVLCFSTLSNAKGLEIYPLVNFSAQNLSLDMNECVARINLKEMSPYKWLAASDEDYGYKTEEAVRKYGTIHQGRSAADYLKNTSSRNSGEGSLSQFLSVVDRMLSQEYIHQTKITKIMNLSSAEKSVKLDVVVKKMNSNVYSVKPVAIKTKIHATSFPSIDVSVLSLNYIGMQTQAINNLVSILTIGVAPAAMHAINTAVINPWNEAVEAFGEKQRKERALKTSKVTEQRINQVLKLLTTYEAIRILEYSCAESEEELKGQQIALAKYLTRATIVLNDFIK